MNATVVSPPAELEQSPSQRWMDRLSEEGYRPRLELNDLNPSLCRLALLQAANEVNSSTKGTKVTVDFEEGEAFFLIEAFGKELPTTETLARMLSHCSFAARRFFTRLRESPRPAVLLS